jgi:hypothetical protein
MTSNVFELSRTATAALERHQSDIANATPEDRAAALEFITAHLADIGLAIGFANARQAENIRNQIEHDARVKAEKVAARIAAWSGAKVGTTEGLARFWCDVVGATITACDAYGQPGNKAANATGSEAVADLHNQRSEKQFVVSLPPGFVAIAADADLMPVMADRWALPFTAQWSIGGRVYSLYHADIQRGYDCNRIAFKKTIRCGLDAAWSVKPDEVELDAEGLLPALPAALQEAIKATSPGAEGLLEKFVIG